MGSDFSYDPVTAIEETTATGQTAEIFADIRRTMEIPLVTSIWRGLAGMGDSLGKVWTLAKPIYASGLPAPALARIVAKADLPRPEPLVPAQLACVGVGERDLDDIRAILAAYNRSNGLNLVALAALIAPPASDEAAAAPSTAVLAWPPLRPLPARDEIDADTWEMIRHINTFGAPGIEAGVATLWRHLAYWPGLLALVHSAFAPLQVQGAIAAASARLVSWALDEGAHMAWLRPAETEIPRRARDTVTGYVTSPTQVARMVAMGHALEIWLGCRARNGR